jgi:hypothetical protein
MPYFPGQWFPKREEETCNGLFEASMLALLKPWRTLADLKQENQSFHDAFNIFVANAPAETCWIMKNVQFFHECSKSARQHNTACESTSKSIQSTVYTEHDTETEEQSLEDMDADPNQFDRLISEEDIYQVLDQPYSPCKQLFAEAAIDIGMGVGVLRDDEYSTAYPQAAPLANDDDLQQFQRWEAVLQNIPDETTAITSLSKTQNLLPLVKLPIPMEIDSEPTVFTIP